MTARRPRIFALIARLPLIIAAYLAACAAAGAVAALLVVLLPTVLDLLSGRNYTSGVAPNLIGSSVEIAVLVSILAAIYALLPTAALIAFAEARRQRSAALYGTAGVLAATLALGGLAVRPYA